MEREKLIKALEICTDPNTKGNCVGRQCPFAYEDRCLFTTLELLGDVLALIKELTEENERWKAEAENQSILWRQHFESIYESAKKTLKADTVRKMHSEIEKRCIKGGIYPAFVKSTIDQIAKEMLEDDKMQ